MVPFGKYLNTRVLALPQVVHSVADAVFATGFGDRHAGFALLQHGNNLALCKSAFLQGSLRLMDAPKFYPLVPT